MLASKNISVLHIDLEKKEFVTKAYPDFRTLIGGVGVASRLVLDHYYDDPIVFAVGPLNGFYPFASKTCAAFLSNDPTNPVFDPATPITETPINFVDTYGGGRLSTRLKFAGIDAIIFEKKSYEPLSLSITNGDVLFLSYETEPSALGIPGKRSILTLSDDSVKIERSFSFGDKRLAHKLLKAGVISVVVSGTQSYKPENFVRYEREYYDILNKVPEMLVQSGSHPSCSGCPMGCSKASVGENGGNILVHSLVSCIYSEAIYSKIPVVFASLGALGYDYTHEELEALPGLVYSNIRKINEKTAHR